MSRAERIRDKYLAKGISLDSPATEELVSRYETCHGIAIPTAFREYLTVVANGGSGPPAEGLEPICLPTENWRERDRTRDILKPFPFTRHWIWRDTERSDEGTILDARVGSIFLGSDGCGMDWHLIVTGPDRGIPWMICEDGIQPVCPKRDFLDWVDDWLDGRDSFYGFEY